MESHLHFDESPRSLMQTEDRDTTESACSPYPHLAFDAFAQTCAIFPMEEDDLPEEWLNSDDESSALYTTSPASDLSGNESWGYLSDDKAWDTDVVDDPDPDPDYIPEQPQADSEQECHGDEHPMNDSSIKTETDSDLDHAIVDDVVAPIPALESPHQNPNAYMKTTKEGMPMMKAVYEMRTRRNGIEELPPPRSNRKYCIIAKHHHPTVPSPKSLKHILGLSATTKNVLGKPDQFNYPNRHLYAGRCLDCFLVILRLSKAYEPKTLMNRWSIVT